MALAKEWMRKDPFYGYKMAQDETDPVFLTYPELQSVMEKEFTIPRLELVRDIFVFSCFTGLAFADVSTLTKNNLMQDNNGDWWIRKGRIKMEHRHTGRPRSVTFPYCRFHLPSSKNMRIIPYARKRISVCPYSVTSG